jgi:hypothetical protein
MSAGPIPAWKSIANHANVLNSGLSPSLPMRSFPYRLTARKTTNRRKKFPANR